VPRGGRSRSASFFSAGLAGESAIVLPFFRARPGGYAVRRKPAFRAYR
jgi:hypothetical protein